MSRVATTAALSGWMVVLSANLSGCGGHQGASGTQVALADFSRPREDARVEAMQMDPRVLDGTIDRGDPSDEDMLEGALGESAGEGSGDGSGGGSGEGSGEVLAGTRGEAAAPAPAARSAPRTPPVRAARTDGSRVWPVESLIGQVNGRPIFAEAFFEPLEDQLRVIAAGSDRAEARRALEALVARRFRESVDSELVVAEAESKLSPEQQAGLFAWLRSLQEETIARRGGSRASAEASLEEEGTGSLEEFLRITRDTQIARRLLEQRIEPRAIVSWRDVVQEYERRSKEFNPRAVIRIGRIRLATQGDAALIEQVNRSISEGEDFATIAGNLKLADGGLWNTFELPEGGIAGLEFSDAIKSRLEGLPHGAVSRPLESRDFVSWFTVIDIETPRARSIYDPDVQLALEDELRARRRIIERDRYLASLRSRWVTDEISRMERKLIDIALQRYWQ